MLGGTQLHGRLRMKDVHFLEVVSQILPFVGTEHPHRQAENGPQVHHLVSGPVVLTELVNLGVTVMATCDTVSSSRPLYLLILQLSEFKTLLLETGLQKAAATAATIIVGPVGVHLDNIVFSHYGLHHKPQVLGEGISKTFADDLAGILNGELDLQVFVPVRVDLQFSFPDPFGVVFVDVLYFEVVLEVEFFQSGPD